MANTIAVGPVVDRAFRDTLSHGSVSVVVHHGANRAIDGDLSAIDGHGHYKCKIKINVWRKLTSCQLTPSLDS